MQSKQSTILCRLKKLMLAIVFMIAFFTVSVWGEGLFTDVASGYWGAPYIESAVNEGIIKGYAISGTDTFVFKPENMVSKQESLAMLYRTLDKAGLLKEVTDLSLDYLPVLTRSNIADWAGLYAAYGFKYSYITETDFTASTATLKGGAVNAPRQMVAAWSAKAMNYELSPVSILPYADALDVDASEIPYVDALYRNNIMRGDTEKNFHAKDGIKRSEFAAICTRLLTSARESGSDVQAARKFEDSYIIDSGTVKDINVSQRTLLMMTVDGSTHRVRISSDAMIILNGQEVSFSELSVLWNKYASVSCLMGAGKQVLIQTSVQVLSGTVEKLSFEDDYAVLTLLHEDGKRIQYCYNDDTAMENVIAQGRLISFIADGVYLLETR
ncbi:MAG: S-layer homology domain-containing protein [Clostridia bacterium]|nr:S-layer homology domain-containing protein [Clostridia bacterium]